MTEDPSLYGTVPPPGLLDRCIATAPDPLQIHRRGSPKTLAVAALEELRETAFYVRLDIAPRTQRDVLLFQVFCDLAGVPVPFHPKEPTP